MTGFDTTGTTMSSLSQFPPHALAARLALVHSVLLLFCHQALPASSNLMEINPPPAPAVTEPVALTGARLIDGRGGPVVENSVVVVMGDTILSAGPEDFVTIPKGAERIDVSGFSLLPGFIDSHFHSVNDIEVPAKFLTNGVTTFRDPGHPFSFYQAVMQTDRLMPRVFLCGAHLDAYPPIWPQQARLIGSAADARDAVNSHVDNGATAIKIYFRLPLEYFRPITETAKERDVVPAGNDV